MRRFVLDNTNGILCNERVTTRKGDRVISDPEPSPAISAGDAHQIARITYRQLDHWARQGWVQPSLDPGRGRSGKRLYSADDVLRLDLLRHLAFSRVNAAVAGPAVAGFHVPDGDVRVLWGPVSSKEEAPGLRAAPATEVLEHLEQGGAYVVYNPTDVRVRIELVSGQLQKDPMEDSPSVSQRETA